MVVNLPLAKRQKLRTYYDYYEHHGYKKIYNKTLQKYTYLLLVNKNMTPAECYQAGANPAYSTAPGGPFTDAVKSDVVTEIDPDTGKVVWEWAFWDHLIQNYDSRKDNWYSNIATKYYNGNIEEAFYRRLDVNAQLYQQGAHGPIPDWQHLNAVDYNAERGEIMISSRHTSEIYVIDHDRTFDPKDPYTLAASPLGDFMWRFGSPHNYASAEQLSVAGIKEKAPKPTLLDAQYGQMWGQHDSQWIQRGLPGAGQILVFDNGNGRPASAAFSAVLQINPYDNNGNYIRELSAGYLANLALLPNIGPNQQNVGLPNGRNALRPSKLITWSFVANDGMSMFSAYVSGAQRLPNGNTLITVSDHNKYIEVTEKGQLVSEYINPKTTSGFITNTLFDGKAEPYYNLWADNVWVTKFRRYPVTHPAFIGKIIEPQGPITNRIDPYYSKTGFGFGPVGGGGTGGGAGAAAAGGGAGY
jgi:hypothetical protein